MMNAIHESNARWLEAVIRFVDTMPLRDQELRDLLGADVPNYDLVRARLLHLATQKLSVQRLVLVTYGPSLVSRRPLSASYAITLLKLRQKYRVDAKKLASSTLSHAS